jgi:hypothetical protein
MSCILIVQRYHYTDPYWSESKDYQLEAATLATIQFNYKFSKFLVWVA